MRILQIEECFVSSLNDVKSHSLLVLWSTGGVTFKLQASTFKALLKLFLIASIAMNLIEVSYRAVEVLGAHPCHLTGHRRELTARQPVVCTDLIPVASQEEDGQCAAVASPFVAAWVPDQWVGAQGLTEHPHHLHHRSANCPDLTPHQAIRAQLSFIGGIGKPPLWSQVSAKTHLAQMRCRKQVYFYCYYFFTDACDCCRLHPHQVVAQCHQLWCQARRAVSLQLPCWLQLIRSSRSRCLESVSSLLSLASSLNWLARSLACFLR